MSLPAAVHYGGVTLPTWIGWNINMENTGQRLDRLAAAALGLVLLRDLR